MRLVSSKLFFYLLCCNVVTCTNSEEMAVLRNRVKRMFYHAYNGYMTHAYPLDELRPLTCDGHDTWGSYALTLVDALDTLVILENHTEFRRASRMLLDHLDINRNVNISVFETNIRVVGGLLSAHLFSRRAGFEVESTWPCSGPLLRYAELFASKLLPAFDTPTGMPYGTVNLASNGVPLNETPVTCVAGVGTMILEFGTLSRLTGDPRFEAAAMRAIRALWRYRSSIGLVGNHIDVLTGRWTAVEFTIGGGVDSFFEYLVKGSILLRLPELDAMFREYKKAIDLHAKHGDWHFRINKDSAHVTRPLFQSLDAFWPGTLSLFGHLDEAIQHLSAYHEIWKQYGFIPEAYNLIERRSVPKQSSYLLRPEFIESVYYLYRATKDPVYISMAIDVLTSIEQTTKTSCGHATVANVVTHQLENRMESFFLAETIKYLYLIFDEDNFVNHIPGDQPAPVSHLSSAGVECTLENGGYVFNTEAHPIDPGALHCCSPKLMSPSSSSATATEAILTAQHHPKQNTVSAEDLERLSREEAQYQPTEELLNLVDSVFAEHLNIDPDMTDPTSCISFEPTPTRKPCANLSSINQALVEPWLDLRQFVLQLTNDTLMKNHSSGTVGSLDEDSVITDFNAFEPPLLTCPYPPFHQRYTYSGQMVITEN